MVITTGILLTTRRVATQLADELEEAPPVPDPLGISDVDLRITQELYSSGRLFKAQNGGYARRSTAFVGGSTSSPSKLASASADQDDDDDDDDSEEDEPRGEAERGQQAAVSVGFAVRSSKVVK